MTKESIQSKQRGEFVNDWVCVYHWFKFGNPGLTTQLVRGWGRCFNKHEMNGREGRDPDEDGGDRGLLWKLPVVSTKELGKIGPGFGFGAGCGFGFGIGLLGGAGFGPGIPGLQFGFGVGIGCGVGLGFGYGVGRGIAYDENRRYSNVGKPLKGSYLPSQNEMAAVVDELVVNTKKLIVVASKELDKWRR